MMRRIAVIPARANSKRIPNKALQKIGGRTLLARTIATCKKVSLFDDIVVSTDSPMIAEEARANGVFVPILREYFTDEFSPVSHATCHSLFQYENLMKLTPETTVVQIMPNCPFVSADTILAFISEFESRPEITSLLSCVRLDPINRHAFELSSSGVPGYRETHLDFRKRTQDFSPLFVPSGSVWVSNWNILKHENDFYSSKFRFQEISFWEGFDIDTPEQLRLSELYSQMITE